MQPPWLPTMMLIGSVTVILACLSRPAKTETIEQRISQHLMTHLPERLADGLADRLTEKLTERLTTQLSNELGDQLTRQIDEELNCGKISCYMTITGTKLHTKADCPSIIGREDVICQYFDDSCLGTLVQLGCVCKGGCVIRD